MFDELILGLFQEQEEDEVAVGDTGTSASSFFEKSTSERLFREGTHSLLSPPKEITRVVLG